MPTGIVQSDILIKPVAIVRVGRSGGGAGAVGATTDVYKLFFKRPLDVVLVCISAPFALILVAVFAGLVSLSGGRPFYCQDRLGRGGRHFRMWKIRSMVVDADAILADYLTANPEKAEEWDDKQKLENDPRVTWLGRFVRRTSLDELPQLWNVLCGDMSLVGPRPMMVNQADLYPGKAYYRLRPGLTGTWQISERNDVSFGSRANFDASYEANLSFRSDARIILETVRVVCRGTGQ